MSNDPRKPRGPIGLFADAYRNDPAGILAWIALIAAIGILLWVFIWPAQAT
jgi:hypothetical protein